MSRPVFLIHFVGAALFALIVSAAPARAQNYYWQAPAGGDGTWNFTNVNWATAPAGPVNTSWNNNTGSIVANFGNTAGTITLVDGPERNVAGLNFTSSGYVLNGQAIGLVGVR